MGIPILVFQHIPMLTMNTNEKTYYCGGTTALGTADNYAEIKDMTSHSGYVGHPNHTEETLAVCEIIRKNSDVIKGVFVGHEHSNMYTEIVALDKETGETLYDENGDMVIIPQHTITAAAYGVVGKIVIE